MRDHRIDLLRFVGLAMIILAHTDAPGLLFQLRNFDVPLMVMASGMSFAVSYRANERYSSYVRKRIKRLICPVWIFLTLYFLALAAVSPDNPELNARTVFTSYTLISGIGGVWIIRVFLLVALVAPIVFRYSTSTSSHKRYFLVLAACLGCYEVLRYLSLPHIQGGIGKAVASIAHYAISYAIVFAIGLRLPSLSRKQTLSIALVCLGTWILVGSGLIMAHGEFIPTQQLKYPPSIYYLSYAILVSCLLWAHSSTIDRLITRARVSPVVLFIARNSLWIYLWHLPLAKTIHGPFAVKYVAVFTLAVAVTYLQVRVVSLANRLLPKRVFSENFRRNIGAVLTG